jgi:hypothetical protein
MGIDAVLLLRVNSKAAFAERFARMGLPDACLDPLDDGSVLLSVMQAFGSAFELRVVLAHAFAGALEEIHDDPRGLLAFPDVCEPRARTYEGIVAEVGAAGVWLPLEPPSQEEMLARMASMLDEVDELVQRPSPTNTDAIAAADARELAAELKRLGHESLDAMVSRVATRAGDDVSFACVVQAKREPALAGGNAVNAVHRLTDGAWVVVTTSLSTAADMIALSLGEEWKPWLAEHDDARGVLVFSATHLPRVLACDSYEAAVTAAGSTATWVHPTTAQELIAARGARARKFLADG